VPEAAGEGGDRLRIESASMAVRTWPALSPHAQQRLLEIIPGAFTWAILLTPLIIAFAIRLNDPADLWVIGLGAVLLDAYWFLRAAVTVYWMWRTLAQLRYVEAQDWWAECQGFQPAAGATGPGDITHCALIPTYTERYEVLRATVDALVAQDYPEHLKVCAIITRETDLGGIENVNRLREELGHHFRAFIHIRDPLLPGIVVGKSAAMAYGGPVLRRHCDELGLDPARTLVTDLDSDFRLHPQYFAYVTWNFLHVDEALTSIWQPVPVFLNNLWRVPAAVRVMATAATQWQMFLHQHPDRLVMFSSYTMPMKLLSEVGYWDSDVIPEDSRFFWKAFFHYGAQLRVRPAFLPVYGDAPRARDYASTHASQYNQIKRWAWGATDVPYVCTRLLAHPEIPWRLRARRFRYLMFNHLTWATLPLLLPVAGSLPALIDLDYSLSPAATALGLLTTVILTMTLLNTMVLIVVDRSMCPKPAEWGRWRRIYADVQLFLYPVVGLALSVIPALEAQTRLMFGAYLEYHVTAKE
jgi:cellulose synthase/poly-beta-1,6-N-acetylglucosamine synthase-like glycosyltransferase